MKFIIYIISLLIFMYVTLLYFGRKGANEYYSKASKLETNGFIKEACYYYAIAIINGYVDKRFCEKKISTLQNKYGPFEYKDIEDKLFHENDHDGLMHHEAVVWIIKSVSRKRQ